MRPISILYYAIALFAPVFLFALTLVNEQYPILPWLLCPVLFMVAAVLSVAPAQRTFKDPVFTKIFFLSVLVGLAEAAAFTVVA